MAKFIDETALLDGAMRVRRFSLDNGLHIVLAEDHAAPVVSYHTWFRVGSSFEKVGKTGIAHLFEHLMFNQSKRFKQGEFDRLIEEAGGSSNAATWVDWTYYHENVPRDALELIVTIESDRIANLVLKEKQVASEKEVVMNERRFRVDDDVEGSASEALLHAAFEKHPYGWPTIGWMPDIESFTTEDCEQFYRTYYAPNNATLVITGDIDEKSTLALIEKYYGTLKPAKLPQHRLPQEPKQKALKFKKLSLETQSEKLALAFKSPAFMHPDHAPLSVLADILFAGRSARLVRALVYEKEICTEARGSVMAFREAGIFEAWFSMRPGHRAREAMLECERHIETLKRKPVATRELKKVQNQLELSLLQEMESAAGKAEQIGFYESVCQHVRYFETRLNALRAVTANDIQRVAAQYLTANQLTLVHVVPNDNQADNQTDNQTNQP